MRSTFSRTFFSAAMVLLMAMLLIGTSFQALVRNYLTEQAMEGLKNDGNAISALASAYYTEGTLNHEDFLVNLSFVSQVSQADAVICCLDSLNYVIRPTLVQRTFRKVFPYILLGVAIGAVIHNWIPQSWVESVLGSRNPFGVVLAVLLGAPMYADIFGTIPVAEALLTKGAQLGTVLSFMMAVTTLSLPSLVMLRKAVKPRLLAVFVGFCITGIILVGYFFNAVSFLLMG